MIRFLKNIINNAKGNKEPTQKAKYENPYQNSMKIDEYPLDIIKKIESDFPNSVKEVEFELNWFLNRNDYCRHPRFLRCILGYANSDMNRLKKAMEIGDIDYRDLILLAEYKSVINKEPIRLRDYNNEFGKEKLI